MKRQTVAPLLFAGALFLFSTGAAFADHLADAIGHTREAIEVGKKGDAAALVSHAKAALKSATSVYASTVGSFSAADADAKAQANAHLKDSLTNLKAAIQEGKKKHAETATQQAEAALTHLEAAPH